MAVAPSSRPRSASSSRRVGSESFENGVPRLGSGHQVRTSICGPPEAPPIPSASFLACSSSRAIGRDSVTRTRMECDRFSDPWEGVEYGLIDRVIERHELPQRPSGFAP